MSSEAVLAPVRPVGPDRLRALVIAHPRLMAVLAFVCWSALVLQLAVHHAVWRDEVRALSLAIDPATLSDMVAGLRGEGHPILWYLLLRTSYFVFVSLFVLPAVSFFAAAAAIAFLFLRAPFPLIVRLLIACSAFVVIEYAVVSRNYGIAMLPMFVFADRYDAWRRKGIGLGVLLFLLANTSVHAALAVIMFCGVWLVETLRENGLVWSRPLRVFLLNALVAAAGVLFAAWITTGSANDTYSSRIAIHGFSAILTAILNPGEPFQALVPMLPAFLLTMLLFGCLLLLLDRPALCLGGLGALLLMSLLFVIVYPGMYRHAAIWILVFVSLLWIAERRRSASAEQRVSVARRMGWGFLLVLLCLQVGSTIGIVIDLASRPWSHSRALASLLKSDPKLAGSIVLAEPDYLVEPLRYYGLERTWLPREDRFGNVVNFTRNARLDLDLGAILETAERLRRENGREVVILLGTGLADAATPAAGVKLGPNWTFSATAEQILAFGACTERLASFKGAMTDEDYSVYRLR